MNKNSAGISKGESLSFPSYKSYAVDEILVAGGTTAFAEKLGKDPEKLVESRKNLPKDSFLIDEETEAALRILNEGN